MTEQSMTVVREWDEADGPEPENGWEWPAPPHWIESRAGGDLRARALSRIGRSTDDAAEVLVRECETEGGWSEYTVECDYEIEVWLKEGRQEQRVWRADIGYEGTLPAFLRWLDGADR